MARQTLVARSVENVTVEEQEEVETAADQHDNVEKAKPLRRTTSESAALEASNEAESSCILS